MPKPKTLFAEDVSDPRGRVRITTRVDDRPLAWICVAGYGSVEGMETAAASFAAAFATLSSDTVLPVVVDLSELDDASLAGQLSLVPWLLQHQHRISSLAVLGAQTTALKIARAVVRLLPFSERIAFFDDEASLRQWFAGL